MLEGKRKLFFLMLILCILIIAKAINAGVQQMAIADAIYLYQRDRITANIEYTVTQDDKEEYMETFLRWWDWSYNRILDTDKFLTILPYIGKMDAAEVANKYFG